MNEFKVGDMVRFIIKDDPELYGKIGKIQYYYSKAGYYRVIFDGKVEVVFNFELEPAKKEFLIYRRKE
jgi:hypothetical protein